MERIGDEVQRELRRGRSRDAIPLAAVTAIWSEAVGETVARRAWPLRLGRDGTLHVAVASATWANELAHLQDEVLARLADRLGSAAPPRLAFKVGPIPEPATANAAAGAHPPACAPPSEEVDRRAASAACEIDDPDLRALAERAARASLSRGG